MQRVARVRLVGDSWASCCRVLSTVKRSHWTRLCGACTMLVLLGVPWVFSAFAVIDASDNSRLRHLEGVFNVSFVRRISQRLLRSSRPLVFSLQGIAMPKGLYFTAVFFFLFSFFLFTPNVWVHWTDLNQIWTHIHLWELFGKFCPNTPGIYFHGLGAQNRFLGPTSNFDRIYLCKGTWYPQLERNLWIYTNVPTCRPPEFGERWSRNSWERLASFCPPLIFGIGRHCQRYPMDVI